MPVLAVIAGPNGSGKTTFSKLWRHCLSYPLHNFPVSDPDALMAVLTRNDPVAAGRLTPTDRQHMLKSGRSFAVETTLAGASTLKLMRTHPCRHRPEMWCLISPNATGSSSSTTCSTRNSFRASWKGRGLRRGMSARSLRMMRFVRSAGKKSVADWLSGYFSSSTRTARQGSASRPRCPKP